MANALRRRGSKPGVAGSAGPDGRAGVTAAQAQGRSSSVEMGATEPRRGGATTSATAAHGPKRTVTGSAVHMRNETPRSILLYGASRAVPSPARIRAHSEILQFALIHRLCVMGVFHPAPWLVHLVEVRAMLCYAHVVFVIKSIDRPRSAICPARSEFQPCRSKHS